MSGRFSSWSDALLRQVLAAGAGATTTLSASITVPSLSSTAGAFVCCVAEDLPDCLVDDRNVGCLSLTPAPSAP